MINSDSNTTQKKSFQITEEVKQKFLDKLPALEDHNNNPKIVLTALLKDGTITEKTVMASAAPQEDRPPTADVHFSYDFVFNRWFLDDDKIEVVEK